MRTLIRYGIRYGIAGILIAFAGCSAKKIMPANDDTVRLTDNAVFTAAVSSVRGERSRYTVELRLTSLTDAAAVLSLNELKCYRGARPGTLRELPDGATAMHDSGYLALPPHETTRLKLVCRHGEGVAGDFKITFPKVYAGEGQGVTAGRVLARDLELEISAK